MSDTEDRIHRSERPGAPPGTLTTHAPGPTTVRVFSYSRDEYVEETLENLGGALEPLLEDWDVSWVDVDGVGDVALITALGERFGIHPLVLEDVVHVHQRIKAERYEHMLFVVLRMAELEDDELVTEQLAILLGQGFVVTFQEGRPGDCLEPVRERLRASRGIIRERGPDFLVYALIDAVIDHYFPLLERYFDDLDQLEDTVLEGSNEEVIPRLHWLRRELMTLRRTLLPLRDVLAQLRRDQAELIAPETAVYLRDVADHTEQLLDLVETYRELARSLIDLDVSLAGNRMNEVMKVLTIIGSIFLPLTFVTGLYGMNFDRSSPWNMPELQWAYGYEFALGLMVSMAVGMLVWFWRRGWLE